MYQDPLAFGVARTAVKYMRENIFDRSSTYCTVERCVSVCAARRTENAIRLLSIVCSLYDTPTLGPEFEFQEFNESRWSLEL